MRIKNTLFILSILVLSLILTSILFISAATTSGTLGVGSGDGDIVIRSGCQEDWSGSTWSQCNDDNEQTFICFDKNLCGTEELKPAQCGEVRTCETATGSDGSSESSTGGGSGGGGGGGGSSSSSSSSSNSSNNLILSDTCTENWECEPWSNVEGQCGVRTCNDKNSCGTENLKPETTRACANAITTGITGNVIGGIGNFTKSRSGLAAIFVIVVVAATIAIFITKKRSNVKNLQTG